MIELDYDAGYFRARRSVWRALRGDAPTCMVWLELEERARYSEPGPMIGSRGRVVDLDIGEAVLGRRDLARVLGLGEQQVRTAIKKLQKLGIIRTRESTHLGTVVTLVGFDGISHRPEPEQPAGQPVNQPTANPQPTTNKTEIRSGDLDLLSADPSSGPQGDRGSARLGPTPADLCEPGDGAKFTELLTELQRGRAEGGNVILLKAGGGKP